MKATVAILKTLEQMSAECAKMKTQRLGGGLEVGMTGDFGRDPIGGNALYGNAWCG